MERLFATPKMIPFLSLSICAFVPFRGLSCSTLRCGHESFVLAAFDPLKDLRDAPDWKWMRQSGCDHVGPETIERLLVVVLLKIARLGEKLIVVNTRREGAAG